MGIRLTADNLGARGVRHGFSLRTGGVSEPPFDSLNLARAVGDASEAVAENHVRLAAATGYQPDALFEVSQVHGCTCVEVGPGSEVLETRAVEADALVARQPGVAVGVRVADCLPVLLADSEVGVVAAAHAGWRGIEARVVGVTLDAMVRLGASRDRIRAALGPHIRPCCFEVGEEVAERIAAASEGADVIAPGPRRPHVDLAAAAAAQLHAAGVLAGHVERVEGCTHCDEARRFFSYRRDGRRSGRQLAVIVAG